MDALQQMAGEIASRPYQDAGGAIVSATGVFGHVRGGSAGTSTYLTPTGGSGQLDRTFFSAARVARTSAETRPVNTAYAPRLHA